LTAEQDEWTSVEGSMICVNASAVIPQEILNLSDNVAELSGDVEQISSEMSALRESNIADLSGFFILNCGNATETLSDDDLTVA